MCACTSPQVNPPKYERCGSVLGLVRVLICKHASQPLVSVSGKPDWRVYPVDHDMVVTTLCLEAQTSRNYLLALQTCCSYVSGTTSIEEMYLHPFL